MSFHPHSTYAGIIKACGNASTTKHRIFIRSKGGASTINKSNVSHTHTYNIRHFFLSFFLQKSYDYQWQIIAYYWRLFATKTQSPRLRVSDPVPDQVRSYPLAVSLSTVKPNIIFIFKNALLYSFFVFNKKKDNLAYCLAVSNTVFSWYNIRIVLFTIFRET